VSTLSWENSAGLQPIRNYAMGKGMRTSDKVKFTEWEIQRNLQAVRHAVAQQELEGLKVSQSTIRDMQRAARGEIGSDEVIRKIYARFSGSKHVQIFRP
jgi:hypothetical protein